MKLRTLFNRWGVLAISLGLLTITTGVVGKAASTFTAPNVASINYNLAPGATSSALTPATNTPVALIGANSTSADFSASSATLIHIPNKMIRWVGLESVPSATIVHGGSTTPGTHIVYLDYDHKVDVEILSADEIDVHNSSSSTEAGTVKLIW